MTENTQTVLNTVLARKSGKVLWPNLNAIQLTKQNVAQKLVIPTTLRTLIET